MIKSCEIIHRDRFLCEVGCHPSDAAIILLSGEYICSIRDSKITVHVGDMLVFPKGEIFQRKIISPIDALLICFDKDPESFCGQLFYPGDMSPRQQSSSELMEQAVRNHTPLSVIEHFLNDILICNQLSDNGDIREQDMLICRQYIKDNCTKSIDLEALADRFGYTKQGLILKFKKNFGQTPISFLIRMRIDMGKALLLNTDHSISHISSLCGYSSPYYFSNAFKNIVGSSPSQFRICNKL